MAVTLHLLGKREGWHAQAARQVRSSLLHCSLEPVVVAADVLAE
jgi:hypothetical protein